MVSQTTIDSLKPDSDAKKDVHNRCADSFCSESNMAHLRRGITALNAGKGKEHEVLAAEDNGAIPNEDRPRR